MIFLVLRKQMQLITHFHFHPLVLDKVALLHLGILTGQGGHRGKRSHPEILDFVALRLFEDKKLIFWNF